VASGFRREVDEKCVLIGCYAASSGNSLQTFRADSWHLKMRLFQEYFSKRTHGIFAMC